MCAAVAGAGMAAGADSDDHVRAFFETADLDAQAEFLETYVYDAVERLPATEDCEAFVFVRADGAEDVDGGRVVVDAYGDADAVLDRERETWDALVDDGPLTDWYRPDYDTTARLAEAFGEDAWRRGERLRYVASAMTAATHDLLDERPAPVDVAPETDGEAVGWHRVLHLLSNQWGYDVDEEMDAYAQALRMGATIVGKSEGMDAAESFVADVEAELEDALEDLAASGEAGEGMPEMDEDDED